MSASASKSALLLSPCLRWAGPEAKEYRDEFADTTKRDKGILFHDAMDGYYRNVDGTQPDKPFRFDSEVNEWVNAAIQWSVTHLEPQCKEILSEVYVAYNFATGVAHADPLVRNRGYPSKPGFLPGTADLVCILRDDSLLVADWKTGGGTGADKQLLSLACGLQKVYRMENGDLRRVRLAVLYAGRSGVLPNEWEVSESDLQSHADAMAFQMADVGVRNDPVVGIHCTQLYCNHLAYCPGITGIVEEQSEGGQSLLSPERLVRKFRMTDTPSSDEEAGYTMERVTAARRQMDYYEVAIRKYANEGGKVIAGDFEFRKTNSGFRWKSR